MNFREREVCLLAVKIYELKVHICPFRVSEDLFLYVHVGSLSHCSNVGRTDVCYKWQLRVFKVT